MGLGISFMKGHEPNMGKLAKMKILCFKILHTHTVEVKRKICSGNSQWLSASQLIIEHGL